MGLNVERVRERLATKHLGRSIDARKETRSTNDDARAAASSGAPHGHVVVADRQTDGRGSRGRRWSSPGGTDLYASMVLRLPLEPRELPLVTLAIGLAVARVIDATAPGERVEIKWPNDVRVGGRKLAGILVETTTTGATVDALVAGIGVNVNRVGFEADLEDTATSLALVVGHAQDREALLAALLGEIEECLETLVADGRESVVFEVERRMAFRRERVRCGGVEGTLEGLDASGALRIRARDGVKTVLAGTLERVSEG